MRRANLQVMTQKTRFESETLGGWVHATAESLDPEDLFRALKNGHAYSSQGPCSTSSALMDHAGKRAWSNPIWWDSVR
jgi:hypothetical protein